jgi:hypothetical protein
MNLSSTKLKVRASFFKNGLAVRGDFIAEVIVKGVGAGYDRCVERAGGFEP